MEPLLLVEDKTELRTMLRKALERAGYAVDEAPDGAAAIQKLRARRYLLVITDLKMPGASGLDVLRETKLADATIPVLLLTAYGSVGEAVAAMKEGAFDFLQKPVDLDHLKLLVQRAAQQQELLRENLLLREEYSARYGFPRIVGEHPSIREMSQQIQKVAATDSTCLLLGESCTGKELFALAIHHLSQTILFPCRSLRAAGTWNPSPPPSESAGSSRELTDARPRSEEIRIAPSILRAAAGFPAVTLAVVRRAAPAASGDPGPPASAGNRMRLPSSPLQLLPPSRMPSAKGQVLSRRPVWSRAGRRVPKLPAFSNP